MIGHTATRVVYVAIGRGGCPPRAACVPGTCTLCATLFGDVWSLEVRDDSN